MLESISSDVLQSIQSQLSTGNYQSEDDVLRDALASLELRKRGEQRLQEMLAVAEADIAAGRVGEFDREALKREVGERLAEDGICD